MITSSQESTENVAKVDEESPPRPGGPRLLTLLKKKMTLQITVL